MCGLQIKTQAQLPSGLIRGALSHPGGCYPTTGLKTSTAIGTIQAAGRASIQQQYTLVVHSSPLLFLSHLVRVCGPFVPLCSLLFFPQRGLRKRTVVRRHKYAYVVNTSLAHMYIVFSSLDGNSSVKMIFAQKTHTHTPGSNMFIHTGQASFAHLSGASIFYCSTAALLHEL